MHLFFRIYVIYSYAYLSCYKQLDTYPFDNLIRNLNGQIFPSVIKKIAFLCLEVIFHD
jgi:hypothetical protein